MMFSVHGCTLNSVHLPLGNISNISSVSVSLTLGTGTERGNKRRLYLVCRGTSLRYDYGACLSHDASAFYVIKYLFIH